MGNTIGLPACPRGNSQTFNLIVQVNGTPIDITGYQFCFIANRALDGKTTPPVVITWNQDTPSPNGATVLTIADSLTKTLNPGSYFFNVDMMDLVGTVTTILSGTWPIVAVPGFMASIPSTYPPPSGGTGPIAPSPVNIMYKTDFALGVGEVNPELVDHAMWADQAPWTGLVGAPTVFPPDATAELIAHKDQPNGYPSLDATGVVPKSECPPFLLDAPTDGNLYGRISGNWGKAITYPYYYGTDTVNTDNYAVTVSGDFLLDSGIEVWVTITNANTIAGPTLNVNGTGAVPIVNRGNIALGINELGANKTFGVVHDNNSWRVITPVTKLYTAQDPGNPLIECLGYNAVQVYIILTKAGNCEITLLHLDYGVPVYVAFDNSYTSPVPYAILYTNVADAAGWTWFVSNSLFGQTPVRVDNGTGVSLPNLNGNSVVYLKGIVQPGSDILFLS